MKIAMISDAIYPYNTGGKEKRIYEVSTRLARRGNEVHIYTMKWWQGNNIKIENGVYLHGISNKFPLYSKERRSIKQAVLFSLASFKLLFTEFDVIDVDHMPHLILFPIKLVCMLKRKKMLVTWNEVWGRNYWKQYLGFLGILAYYIEKMSVQTADIIIAVSQHTQKSLIIELHFKKKIVTILNGIDSKAIQKIIPSTNKSDIVFAGRMLSHKNIQTLIYAIARIRKQKPNVSCFLIGEGPERSNLEKLVKELHLEKNITFFNFFKKHDDVYALMKASKVFVLPSTREGFGLVILEANACGIPVVAIDHKNNAAKNLIKDGKNGYLSQLNEEDLALKILKILHGTLKTNKDLEIPQSYEWDVITKQIEKVYKTI